MTEHSFLKHLLALAYMNKVYSSFGSYTTRPKLMKEAVWHSYSFAEFWLKTLEEIYDLEKAEFDLPGDPGSLSRYRKEKEDPN